MIKAIFFDQDNTIINTSKVSMKVYKSAIDSIAGDTEFSSSELFNEWLKSLEVVRHSKNPEERFFDFSLEMTLTNLGILDSGELLKKALKRFLEVLEDKIELTPGTKEFLGQKMDLIRIIFTEDKAELNELKMRKLGLLNVFDLRITSEDTGVMKPDPIYLEIGWKKFNLKPEECIYVGDNWEKDCRIGQENGGVGVVFGSDDERSDYSISNMMELVDIISKQ